MDPKTRQDIQVAKITAVSTILAAIIAAAASIWLGSRREAAQAPQAEVALTESLEPSDPAGSGLSSQATATGGLGLVFVGSIAATVKYDSEADTDRRDPMKADLCVLTSVGSYGGATKGCTLTKTDKGWVLVSNGRKATSTCQAMCFNLGPRT